MSGWIPTDDSADLPEYGDDVLLTLEVRGRERVVRTGYRDHDAAGKGLHWYLGIEPRGSWTVVAWTPLPSPYLGGFGDL